MVAFSVTVVQIIMCTTRQPGMKWLTCSLVATWVIALLIITVGLVVPPLSEVQYIAGVACFLAAGNPETLTIRLTYLVLWFNCDWILCCSADIIMHLCPFGHTVLFQTTCHFRRNSVQERNGKICHFPITWECSGHCGSGCNYCYSTIKHFRCCSSVSHLHLSTIVLHSSSHIDCCVSETGSQATA